MPGGKYMKAVTFSYDDGVLQDKRLIRLLNKYGLKATFNINTGALGNNDRIIGNGISVAHVKPTIGEVKDIYEGHELAVHTLVHPNLSKLTDEEIIHQVEDDRLNIEKICGYEVVGMAYPGGTGCMNDHVADVIRNNTGVKYSRTTTSTYNFDLQDDLLKFDPTIYHFEWDKLFELGKKFVEMKPDKPQIYYIWGHAYEFDFDLDYWDRFEEFCKLISGHDDIFYGNNTEVLLGCWN